MAKQKGKPDKPEKTVTKKAGKPPVNNPEDVKSVQSKIDVYFKKCMQDETRPTYCGLAIALDYASRQSLWENSKADNPISLPIKKALLRIEDAYEQALAGNACTGAIFALKNRGWKDKTETEITGKDGAAVAFRFVEPNGRT